VTGSPHTHQPPRTTTVRGVCWRAAAILALGLILYLPWLGTGGLAFSEGHRVIPADELRHADQRPPEVGGRSVWITTLFGRPYLRKPPGTPWAIAASTWACEHLPAPIRPSPEFGARLPSALATIAGAMAVFFVARALFPTRADRAAFYAAALHLTLPVFWEGARTAEIEGLHTGATAVAVALLIATLAARSRRAAIPLGIGAGLAISVAMLAKGPAALPVFLATIPAGALARWSLERQRASLDTVPMTRNHGLRFALAIPLIGSALALWWIGRQVAGLGVPPVLQSPSEFLWSPDRAGRIAALLPTAVAFGLPATLALWMPWGRAISTGAQETPDHARAAFAARAAALTLVIALLTYTAIGVHNPRYAIPAITPITLVVAFGAWGYATGAFTGFRQRLTWHAGARAWATWPTILALGMIAYIALYEQPRRATSGRSAAAPLASAIAGWSDGRPVRVYADHAIEARPELLWYAVREINARGGSASARWTDADGLADAIRSGHLALIRTDDASNEQSHLEETHRLRLHTHHQTQVDRFTFALVQRAPKPPQTTSPLPPP